MSSDLIASWFSTPPTVLWLLGGASLILFFGTIIALPLIIIYLPARYFNPDPNPTGQGKQASAWHLILMVVKNLVGAVLVLAGIMMLVLPGQGLVTLLIGLLLVNFPGKRRLICRLLQQPKILSFINRIRTAAGRPLVEPPPPQCSGEIN